MKKKKKCRELKILFTKRNYTQREVAALITQSIRNAKRKRANKIVFISPTTIILPKKI